MARRDFPEGIVQASRLTEHELWSLTQLVDAIRGVDRASVMRTTDSKGRSVVVVAVAKEKIKYLKSQVIYPVAILVTPENADDVRAPGILPNPDTTD